MMDAILLPMQELLGSAFPLVWTLIKIIVLLAPLMICVAYLTYAERKIIGYMQVRLGPNRVGPKGWLQPIADALKLLTKEIIIPAGANKGLFILGPVLAIGPALAAWAVIPFAPGVVLANIDASVLYVMAIASMGVYGIILAGWASNSKYALLGAMRSAAQIVSYEIAMGFSLVAVLMVSQSLNLVEIVNAQGKGWGAGHGLGIFSWHWLPLFPMFMVYLISAVAETNRAPFDVAEGESEIVAGFHVEYSGMAFAVFFLGGWLSPVGFLPDSALWLVAKVSFILFLFLWFRATFPRYRYDQIMRLGWKVLIPVSLAWLVVVGLWLLSPLSIWK